MKIISRICWISIFSTAFAGVAIADIAVDGFKNCTRTDDGRPVCVSVATGKFSFVTEDFLRRYQGAQSKSQFKQNINQQFLACVTAAYNSPEYALIRQHNPLQLKDLTTEQLTDTRRATDEEIMAINVTHPKSQACRAKLLSQLSQTDPTLVSKLSSLYAQYDENLNELIQKKLSWGEYETRQKQTYEQFNADNGQQQNQPQIQTPAQAQMPNSEQQHAQSAVDQASEAQKLQVTALFTDFQNKTVDPNDKVAALLNYSTFGNNSGTSDSFWAAKSKSDQLYDLYQKGGTIQEPFKTIREIDISQIDPAKFFIKQDGSRVSITSDGTLFSSCDTCNRQDIESRWMDFFSNRKP